MYIKGRYYRGLGYYIEVRTTHALNNPPIKEHIFSTGKYDSSGAVYLNRLKIN